ncbi:hypothetical protein C8F01DRAFT_1110386 [Mycena amicta]|nr:hypothetical protein C8F01DRAFT_1110386 [Mycena amicta]
MFPYQTNPRDKYLAALANVKAAEAEYLAAERLQQEEDALRHRLQQIQALKQPVYPSRYDDIPVYPRHTPAPALDIDALRQQIAAEERQRILREQDEERDRQQELKQRRELELELRKARAHAAERERALAAQQAKLAAFVQRSSQPTVRFVERPRVDNDFTDILRVLGVQPAAVQPPRVEASKAKPTVTLEQLLLGNAFAAPLKQQQQQPAPAAAPVEPTAVTLEQLLSSIFGVERQKQDEPRKAAAPEPAAASPSTCCKPAPAPTAQNPQVGPEQLFNHFFRGQAAPTDMSQLLNMFLGGQPQPVQAESSKASSSQSTETKLKHDLETRLDTRQAKEDQDLAEAIRMSLADLDAANTSTDSKGKAPAPAPVNNVATSVAEIKAIEDSFTSLSNEWVVPEQLDFLTSRTSSPASRGSGANETDSLMSRLTHSAHNQPLRYYHQALSKLLARLDAVESFGDEEVRHARKDVVEKVEGALDEVESVVDARWRKTFGRVEREAEDAAEPEQAPAAVPEDNVAAEPAAPIVDETASYPPSLPDESTETIRPYDVDAPASPVESEVDTFLLPAQRPVESKEVNEEVGSDWSELDA